MDMNHLIGQRFNLISKSDIRYVGTLHEINPEASTIALENVVSHGTEGRRGNPADEIAPSASVYEYIVFRGSDVKDISVAEEQKEAPVPEPPQVPNDPAILGSGSRPGPTQGTSRGQPAQPPQQQPPQQPPHRQPPPGYPQQPPFQGYPPYGQRFGPPGYPPGPGFPNMPYGAPPGWYPPPGQGFPQPPGQFPPQMPIGPPGSQGQRPGPPGVPQPPMQAPKPTSELPVGEKPSSKPASAAATPVPAAAGQQVSTPPVEPKQNVAEGKPQPADAAANGTAKAAPSAPTAGPSTQARAQPTGPRSDRMIPAIPISNTAAKPAVPLPSTSTNGAPSAATQNGPATNAAMQDATRAATAAVAAAMAKLPQPSTQKKQQQLDSAVDNLTKRVDEMRPYDSGRGNRGGYQNQRGQRGGQRGNYQNQSKRIEVPTTDYDFASANAKFNKQDLVKEAIASGSPMGETDENPLEEVAETTSHTNGASGSHGQSVTAYNKSSSFFDNISSESRDREEGTGGRVTGREWRGEEEKKNMETFGQGSVDGNYRGGYRGRGRGRGYGPRGRGRGYSTGRGRGGGRGRGAPQSTGVPT
ncbi:hypothetical protein FQN54_008121 [Arachnomyces sp. PD_36]|nr:hypothetical protein FQN54_008121 [Arachnomyces sp. PD_36]